MKLPAILKDIIYALLHRPVTEKYPADEATHVAERFRGKLHWTPDHCTGCCLCVKDCPANALELITIDKEEKRFVMRYHPDRCIYCGQCVQACRFGCISLNPDEWELATSDPLTLTITYGDEADVKRLMEKQTQDDTDDL